MSEKRSSELGAYYGIFGKALHAGLRPDQVLASEAAAMPALFAKLCEQPPERRRLLIRNSRRFLSWTLGRRLVEEAHRLSFSVEESRNFAELAAELADRLNRDLYPEGAVEDLAASAWAQLANTWRVSADFRKSEEAFAIARHFLARGSGDPLEIARVSDLEASLRRAQRRFADSYKLLDATIAVYERLGENHLLGRTLIKKGGTQVVAGDAESAVLTLKAGLALIDVASEARLVLAGQHNLVGSLAECGRYGEAKAQLEELCHLHQEHGDKMSLLRLLWVKGRIAVGLESYGEAEVALTSAQRGFLRHKQGYTAAVISLDLADLFARQGRTAELKTLAGEMYPIFQAKDIHREAIAALLLFRQALEEERASLELIQGLRTFLSRARSNPRLRYTAPARGGRRGVSARPESA